MKMGSTVASINVSLFSSPLGLLRPFFAVWILCTPKYDNSPHCRKRCNCKQECGTKSTSGAACTCHGVEAYHVVAYPDGPTLFPVVSVLCPCYVTEIQPGTHRYYHKLSLTVMYFCRVLRASALRCRSQAPRAQQLMVAMIWGFPKIRPFWGFP